MSTKNQQVIANLLVSSAGSLTLSDRRLYNYLLHNAFDRLLKQTDFVIASTELEGIYGVGVPSVERLKESLRRLMRTLIEFEVEKKWQIISLLEKAEFDEIKNQLYYSYPADAKIILTNPINLEKCLIQAHFTHKYSNLIYEILASAYYAEQTTLAIEIADLRSRLQLPANKLTNFSDFDRFVLMPALLEINSHASFAVKFQTERKGMKVTHVVFQMTNKRNISSNDSAKHIIPPRRPRLFIDNPDLEWAYAYLLNAETAERRKFFDKAIKLAAKQKQRIDEEMFDRPDMWFKWVADDIVKKYK